MIQNFGHCSYFEVDVIERPDYLANDQALGEDAYSHGYQEICKRLCEKPELVVLLFCNAATISGQQKRVFTRENPKYDSAVISRYNMWSPLNSKN